MNALYSIECILDTEPEDQLPSYQEPHSLCVPAQILQSISLSIKL